MSTPHTPDADPELAQYLPAGNGTTKPSRADRLVRGPFMLLLGLAMHTGLLLLASIASVSPADIWKLVGFAIGSLAYSLLASALIIQGLTDILGPRRRLAMLLAQTKRQLRLWCVITSGIIALIAVLLLLA